MLFLRAFLDLAARDKKNGFLVLSEGNFEGIAKAIAEKFASPR